MLINLEHEKERFKNHKATYYDFGIVKILDFKNPDSNEYRIRFIFEEEYCRLHISGDLGELMAVNYHNMVFDSFEKDFANSPGYFTSKIECMNRDIYVYDSDKAEKEIREIIETQGWLSDIQAQSIWSEKGEEERALEEFCEDILRDFDDRTGIGHAGRNTLYAKEYYEVDEIGREDTGIIELYMLAFKLAMEQIREGGVYNADVD